MFIHLFPSTTHVISSLFLFRNKVMMLILLQFFSQPAPQPKPKKDEKKKRKRPKKGKPLKKLTKGISACSFSQLKTDKEIYVLINNMCKVNQITCFFFIAEGSSKSKKEKVCSWILFNHYIWHVFMLLQ